MGKKFKIEKGKRKRDYLSSGNRSEYVMNRIVHQAREWPIHDCVINPSWREHGLANITLSRKQPNDLIVIGSYLVDTLCLGLKDTFCEVNFTDSIYKRFKVKMYRDEIPIDCKISTAHTIIYGGIKFASSLGFKPQKDFTLSKYLLEKPENIEIDNSIEFGKDGKPMHIQGPYDDTNLVFETLAQEKSDE